MQQRRDKGRIETREYWICDQIEWLIRRHPDRAGLRSPGRVTSQREINAKTSDQTRYFITSLPAGAPAFAGAVRSHWGIENRLHWVWMWSLATITAGCARIRPQKTSPSSSTWQ